MTAAIDLTPSRLPLIERPTMYGLVRETLAFGVYLGLSFLYFGRSIAGHPGRSVLGSSQDPLIFIWSFGWWPHALLHGTNPIVTHALYAPQGFNLMWATSVPGLALAFAPLTLVVGAVASYNVAMVVLPALAAWAGYRLCLELTGSAWASLVGGYLFGFSTYVLGHELHGHVNLTSVFPVPLVALAFVRFFRAEITRKALAVRLGILIALELSFSMEVVVSLTLAIVLGLALAYVCVPDARSSVHGAAKPLVGAYVFATVLTAPLVAYSLIGFSGADLSGGSRSGTDLLDALVPTPLNALMGSAFPTAASHFELEDGAFLGLPTLLILGLLARRSWRSPWTRFLLSAFLLSGVLTLGTALRIDGRRMVYLPLRLARHVPALDNVHWDRCAVYLALCGAVGVATWIGRTRGRVYARPVVLPVFALVAVMPAFWRPDYPSPLERWPFFTSALYRSCLADNERELVFPFGYDGDSMLWQAESGYRFTLAEGYLHAAGAHAPILSSFERDPVAHDLASGRHPTMRALRAFAARKGVTHVIVTPDADYPSEAQLQTFGSVERVGGVLVAPACNVG